MLDNYGIDPVDAAIYNAVHKYIDPVTKKKGVAALAIRIGINEGTLQNKVNIKNSTHHLNTDELDKIILTTADFQILHALNAKYNHFAIQVNDVADFSKDDLFKAMASIDVEKGEFGSALINTIDDDVVTYEEASVIEKEGFDVVRAVIGLVQLIKSKRAHKVMTLEVGEFD